MQSSHNANPHRLMWGTVLYSFTGILLLLGNIFFLLHNINSNSISANSEKRSNLCVNHTKLIARYPFGDGGVGRYRYANAVLGEDYSPLRRSRIGFFFLLL